MSPRCIACAFTSGYEGGPAIAPATASGDGFALGIGVGLILASEAEPRRTHVIAAFCEEHRALTGQSAAVVAAVIA